MIISCTNCYVKVECKNGTLRIINNAGRSADEIVFTCENCQRQYVYDAVLYGVKYEQPREME